MSANCSCSGSQTWGNFDMWILVKAWVVWYYYVRFCREIIDESNHKRRKKGFFCYWFIISNSSVFVWKIFLMLSFPRQICPSASFYSYWESQWPFGSFPWIFFVFLESKWSFRKTPIISPPPRFFFHLVSFFISYI